MSSKENNRNNPNTQIILNTQNTQIIQKTINNNKNT